MGCSEKMSNLFLREFIFSCSKIKLFFANPNSFKSSFSTGDNLVEPEIVFKFFFQFRILRASDGKSLKMPKLLGKPVR